MPPRRTKRQQQATQATQTAPAKRELPVVDFEELADFNESINFLVYGDSGVGKTPFTAQAPNSVILSTEKGTISAKRFGSKSKLLRAPTWDHVVASLDKVAKLQAGEIPGEKRRDWLILDSLTKMQQLMVRWILERIHEEKEDRDLDIPAIQDHQKWQNMFKRFVDHIVDLDINVIFVTTAMHKEDAEGDDLVLPDIQGKDYAIAQYVCAQMDAVFCLKASTDRETDEPYWKLLTKARPPYFAKDRYDSMPGVVIRPTIDTVITAILESAEFNAAEKDLAAKPEPKRKVKAIETDDDGEYGDETEEDTKPARRRTQAKTRTPARKSVSGQRRTVKPEPEDEEDDPRDELDEELRTSHTATSRRAKSAAASKTPAKKTARGRTAKVEEADDFDPDDELADDDDIDFDDE